MSTVAGICLLATEQPALRRQDFYTGFYTERERLFADALKSFAGSSNQTDCNSIPLRREKQQTVSDEAIVVNRFRESGKERRASVIQLEVFLNTHATGVVG